MLSTFKNKSFKQTNKAVIEYNIIMSLKTSVKNIQKGKLDNVFTLQHLAIHTMKSWFHIDTT